MAFNKKTWQDRVSEYPTRRLITHTDSTEEYVEVARAEGTVLYNGDPFNASNMNDLENRINSALAGCSIMFLTETEFNNIPVADRDDTVIYMLS